MNCRLVVTADVGVPAWMWPLLTKSRHTITFLLNPTDFLFRKKLQKNRAELCSSSLPLKAQPSASGVGEITDDAAALWIILTTYRQGILFLFSHLWLAPELWWSFSHVALALTIHTCDVSNHITESIWFGTISEKQPEAPGGPFLEWDVTLRVFNSPVPFFLFELAAWSH